MDRRLPAAAAALVSSSRPLPTPPAAAIAGVPALDDQQPNRAALHPDPSGEPPGLRAQLAATVDGARRLVAAHVELGKAELDEIMSEVGRVALFAGVALGALLLIGLLLPIGLFLFLGEWLFGSLGWGILHGTLLLLGVAVAALVVAVGRSGRAVGVGLLLAIVIGVGVGLLFGLDLSNAGWARLGEQVAPTVSPDVRPLAVGTAALAIVGALVGLLIGARGGMGGAIAGLVGGAIVGAALGAFSAITFGPQVGAAVGVAIGLIAWPVLLGADLARRGVDSEELTAKFTPRRTIDMTKETIEWVRARTPLGPKS